MVMVFCGHVNFILYMFKPKFIGKTKRQKLAKQQQVQQALEKQEQQQKALDQISQKKAQKKTFTTKPVIDNKPIAKLRSNARSFVFDWDKNEDTSKGYDTLIDVTEPNSNSYILQKLETDSVHWSKKKLDKMTARDWRIFKEDFEISTKGHIAENPLRSWKESDIPSSVLRLLEKFGYNDPTPIQRATIPVALKNHDVLGIAETGSGKTLSFLIPILSYLEKLPKTRGLEGPFVLILAPTRELVQQIQQETQNFCSNLNYQAVAIYGGHNIESNVFDILRGCDILIATPGRLLDCLDRKIVVLSSCFYLVMDEADRMIDLGFEEQVTKILSLLPSLNNSFSQKSAADLGIERSITMMYTATMPPTMEKLARTYLRDPSTIIIGNPELAADTVDQQVEFTDSETVKNRKLIGLLNSRQYKPPIIIFVNYKKTIEALMELLDSQTRFKCISLHGSKSQDQREHAIRGLRSGKYDIMIATDIAGRGIDIPDVSLVVNYQMSKQIEDYIHRIGRTGRAGNKGTAMTFLNSEVDKPVLYDLRKMIMKSTISTCPESLKWHPDAMNKPDQFNSLRD